MDAQLTVTALNGFDLQVSSFSPFTSPPSPLANPSPLNQGRKLRTEFKKVLKEGEKERIERDKAIKRMRSQQLLPSLAPSSLLEPGGPPIGTWNRREASAPGGVAYGGGEEEDYGRIVVGGVFSTSGFGGRGGGEYYSTSPPSDVGTSISARMTNTGSNGSESGGSDERFKPGS